MSATGQDVEGELDPRTRELRAFRAAASKSGERRAALGVVAAQGKDWKVVTPLRRGNDRVVKNVRRGC